jgi:D-sedoheptulose 7-phosphate isomerase
MSNNLLDAINESIILKKELKLLSSDIDYAISVIFKAIKNKKKILICGNGGSAADAQHLSAEFLVRLRKNINRKSYPVISLALDTSTLTACGNDIGFDYIFSRNFDALSQKGDILICISTSGNSKNIINVLRLAKKKKIFSISFLGSGGGKAYNLSNLSLIVPHYKTARIQEAHIFLGHYIFETVENKLLKLKG